MSKDFSRRRFLVSATAGIAGLALADIPSALAASPAFTDAVVQGPATALPTLAEIFSGAPGAMTIVNYATYVPDRGRVDASRAEHQVYADALRTRDRLVTGGPLLGDDGRPSGVLLVYQVASKQQAETLVQSDPFVLKGAIEDYRLAEWSILDKNMELLAAALVPEERRSASKPSASGARPVETDGPAMRTYINYARFVSDHAQVERVRPAHQSYVRGIQANGGLIMAGPFADDSGALFIYRARSKEEAMKLVTRDPYHTEGVFDTYALAEWRMFGLNAGLIQPR